MMDALATFLAMGGHGGFVWAAYGVAAAVLLTLLITSVVGMRRAERDLAALSTTAVRRGRGELRRIQAEEGAP